MLKGYRKRFVILNMALVGVVLIVVLTALGITLYRNHYNELKNTMIQVVDPFDSPDDKFQSVGDLTPPIPSDMPELPDGSEQPPLPPDDKNSRGEHITTVFYDADSGNVSVLANDETLGGAKLKEAIEDIVSQSEDFGTLKGHSLVYYRERIRNGYKIAVADTSYISTRMTKTVLELSLVFIVSMALMFFISIRISKFASKPMENAISMEREFVANISHDLKTPITVILANNSIIRQSPDSSVKEQSQWINSTDDAAKSMMDMINEMLTLSSLESAEKSVPKSPVSLSSAVEKSVLQLESLAYDRNISINEDIKENVTVVSAADYAERICTCLVENALKYEPSGGRVGVSLTSSKKKATLTVQNYGSVISGGDLPHIFDRFYRGDKSRSEQSGHGLGLPMVKQMTELIGAEITASSDAENGTVFTVTFDAIE